MASEGIILVRPTWLPNSGGFKTAYNNYPADAATQQDTYESFLLSFYGCYIRVGQHLLAVSED